MTLSRDTNTNLETDEARPALSQGCCESKNIVAREYFPVKLHFVLEEVEKEGLSSVISWQPHGRCFLVREQERFVQEMLPLWFRQTRYASFQRQLNLYGFKRLTTGKYIPQNLKILPMRVLNQNSLIIGRDKGAYYHPCFLRGKRHLAYQITRAKIKGTTIPKVSLGDEPNFYREPYLPTDEVETSLPSSPDPEVSLLDISKLRCQLLGQSRAEQLLLQALPGYSVTQLPSLQLPFFNSNLQFILDASKRDIEKNFLVAGLSNGTSLLSRDTLTVMSAMDTSTGYLKRI